MNDTVIHMLAHQPPPNAAAAAPRHGLRRHGRVFAAAALLWCGQCFANDWSKVSGPSHGTSQVVGQTTAGCLMGAEALPIDGDGYRVVHLDRKRYFGHPTLIRTLKDLGRQVGRLGIGILHIGDLAQARGGPMPSGHRSHQNGLDVDVRFNLDPRAFVNADALRVNISAPSMLNLARDNLDRKLWGQRQITMLEKAAQLPGVERIFVNPHIKKDLCMRVGYNRSWLRKIRPWYGHDDHFHLRLGCPAGSPRCVPQDPVPAGDGCDASLEWWLEQPLPPSRPQPGPDPVLPPECSVALKQR
jgi:penicillin-insensitive murein endopeptidase